MASFYLPSFDYLGMKHMLFPFGVVVFPRDAKYALNL